MYPTLAGYLLPLRPSLVPDLCTGAGFETLLELAAELPAVRSGGFERVLGAAGADLDLALCVRTTDPAARVLRDYDYGGVPARALLGAVAEGPLREAFDVFWLEFDASRGGRRASLFAGPRGEAPSAAIERATELVCGASLEPSVVRELRRLAVTVPGTKLFQVGWMTGRERPGLRLCFAAHTLPSFERMLDRLPNIEQREALRHACRRYAEHTSEYGLAVDISEGEVGERVGLELGFRGPKHEVRLEQWGDLLVELEREGLCTMAERRALLRWPGRMRELDDPERWPAHLRGAEVLLGPYALHLDRILHHTKLVFEGPELRAAKVYFGMIQGWGVA